MNIFYAYSTILKISALVLLLPYIFPILRKPEYFTLMFTVVIILALLNVKYFPQYSGIRSPGWAIVIGYIIASMFLIFAFVFISSNIIFLKTGIVPFESYRFFTGIILLVSSVLLFYYTTKIKRILSEAQKGPKEEKIISSTISGVLLLFGIGAIMGSLFRLLASPFFGKEVNLLTNLFIIFLGTLFIIIAYFKEKRKNLKGI